MSDIDFKKLTDDELITYCKDNNISYLNKTKKPYNRKTLLSNISNKIINQIETKINIDAKLNSIIKACHDKLYKASITGFKALNDIMNIFILVLLEYVFKSNPQKLEDLIKINNLKSKLNKTEIEEYKTYLLDINKFISKFDEKCDFSSIWRNYILFLASLFPSLYDKDDTKFNCKEERIVTDVFKTIASLSNDINDEFIDELAIKHGNIYEYFIGYCGKSENSKAFGQFFTPKPFINAILNDCGFKDMINNLEITNPTLYDPAMGSGGLLGLTYITCKDKINLNNIYGCEIEKDTMRYGESSILITTKIFNNNLIRCNTLDRNTNPYLKDNKKFNIIISNPPFGTKTNYKDLIPDEEIHNKKYKDDIYPIQTNGEKLFIQNIIYLLADGGICALILPDGELMTKNDTNKLIRKFIIDNCKIIKIIEVDSGVFTHTNIKTKVLILKKEKTKDYNYEIDYLNINKKYKVKLIEKFKLNEDYHFSIKTNYEDLIINNKDIEIKTLGEVCDFKCGSKINLNSYLVDKSPYKIIRTRNLKNIDTEYLYINEEGYKLCKKSLLSIGDIIISSFVDSFECVIVGEEFKNCTYNGGIFRLSNIKINIQYLKIILESEFFKNKLKNISKGVTVEMFNITNLQEIKIPIPSLEIQEQIIKQIEDIDILIKLRKDANKNFKKEKEYLNKMINKKILNSNIKTLGEVCEFQNGYSFKSTDYEKNNKTNIGILQIKSIQNGFIDENKITEYIEENKKYKLFEIQKEDILIGLTGTFKIGLYNLNKKSYLNQRVGKITSKTGVIQKYIYYWYLCCDIENEILKMAKGAVQANISINDISNIKIPIPSLEIQEQYIKEIEELNIKFDKLKEDNDYIINNLEEYKKEIFKF
jgi:restriction endonuclease S subunit